MPHAYILLGSNLGNRLAYLAQAQQLIEAQCGNIVNKSGIYETAAWGITSQPSFYNQAIELDASLPAEDLMRALLHIEEQIGRVRSMKYGPRTIDIDILLIDGVVNNTPLLTIPHPFLHERRFALLPLAEIAPMLMHPTLQKNILQLLDECPDTLNVQKITPAAT
ncbi:2-amino-4-hydroxy-6-hydroxymethyldihydropteridine diphosphokinase [Parasediminibacterium sp. JCM 36343]|uniref:2-amino-4-hydroxy-6- hydroxymethyldihydropteridine diphosphokinase n=1 Tax=Parasediminibacterium sp. JCM 36343 TaxID=3374279 RepID=UPI0039798419